ncbi:MAG: transposase [Methanobacteriaceae archaeon]|jgi:transposase-like protein|nr:transposase [Candidatus Methanorudis spinitermitis]
MTTISKSALINNIGSIQLKLFDCEDEKIDFESKAEKYAIFQSKKKNINRNIQILDKGHYEMIKPFCPRCGSLKHVKQGFREIKPKVDNGEKIKISLQRYKCKSCNKKYSTKLENLKKENNSFFESIKYKIRKSKWNRGGSLRKIAKDVKNFLNISVSHQSIKNFLKIDENQVKKEGKRIVRKFNQLSGYLTIDEEYVYINGKRKYKVSLHDRFIKSPIAEEIMKSRTKKKIKALIEEVTAEHSVISLTSDGLKQYSLVSEDLGIIHQRCVFHMMKDCRNEIKRYLKKTKDDLVTKMAILRYLTEINNIFRTFDENECFNRYEAILNKSERLPEIIVKILVDKIIPNIESLTQFTKDNFIPRTSNQAEQHYSKTQKSQTKAKFKTDEGLLEYLALFMTKQPT